MRFLLGLMLGAAAVLLLAQGLSGQGAWRDRLASAVAGLGTGMEQWLADAPWERSPDRESDAGYGPDSRSGDRSHGEGPDRSHEEAPERSRGDALAAAAAAAAEAARQPIPRPPDPQPVDPVAPQPTDRRIGTDSLPAEAVAEVAAHFGETPPRPGPSALPAAGSPPSGDPGAQRVWVPFHSEMSASGFAARLSESLDHPFRVERQGPGRYQVVFPYHSEPERQALLAEAAAATGLSL